MLKLQFVSRRWFETGFANHERVFQNCSVSKNMCVFMLYVFGTDAFTSHLSAQTFRFPGFQEWVPFRTYWTHPINPRREARVSQSMRWTRLPAWVLSFQLPLRFRTIQKTAISPQPSGAAISPTQMTLLVNFPPDVVMPSQSAGVAKLGACEYI